MIFEFSNVKVAGISTVVPQKELSLLDEKNLYGGDAVKIQRVIESSGFLKRRVTEPDVMTSDLCLQAAKDLLANLHIKKEDIDALLFISYTPDYLMPATAYVLHQKLELSSECVVMDIPQACSGYVLGLYQASMLINAGCKKVLLLVGDSFSKFSDMFNNNTAPVFGDAGSATLIEYDENADKISFNINSDGSGHNALMALNGGFKNIPTPGSFYDDGLFKYGSHMDGGRIFDFTIKTITPSLNKLINHCQIDKDEIDYFVMHQANKFILENIARQLDVNIDKMPMQTLSKYGNQCGASIPCAISDSLQAEVSHKKQFCLLAGFGVGLSWASAILYFDHIYCSNIIEYEDNNE